MISRCRRITTCLGLTAAVGCGDALGPTLSDLTGTWLAVAFETTHNSTGEELDWLADGVLAELTMTIGEDGALLWAAREPTEQEADSTTGTIDLDADRVVLTIDDEVLTGTLTLVPDRLTIDVPLFLAFEESYHLVMIFRRA